MKDKKHLITGIILTAIAIITGIFLILISDIPFIQNMELKTLDYRFIVRGRHVPISPDIKIIALDEKSFEQIDEPFFLWPSLIAEVIKKLTENDAKVVGMDLLQRKSIDQYIPGETKKMQEVLLTEKVILISILEPHGNIIYPFEKIRAIVEPGNIGLSNVAPDVDEIIRRQPIYLDDLKGVHLPCFPFVLLSKYSEGELHQGKDGLFGIGKTVIKDKNGYVDINYAGPPGTFETISFCDVLQKAKSRDDEYFRNTFKDKIVLIGRTDPGGKDLFNVPFSISNRKMMSGIEIHANTINTVIQGAYLTHNNKFHSAIILLLFCLTTSLLCYRTRPLTGISVSIVIIFTYIVLAFLLFIHHNFVLDIVIPSLSVPAVFLFTYIYRYLTVERKMKEIRNIFGKMVSPQVEEELWKENISIQPGEGEEKLITVIFTDINSFSDICDYSEAEEVMAMLNEYYDEMIDIVFENRGTIEQFVGDEIMAIYGAPAEEPRQAFLAVKTAVEMIDRLQKMKKKSEGKKGFYETKIGIHTGMMKLGFIGSSKRMEYTTIGKNVNQAARLEALNKNFDPGPMLLASDDILDWPDLMSTLKNRDNNETKRIYDLLHEKCKDIINNQASGNEPDEVEKESLIKGLNELLVNRNLYDRNIFTETEFDKMGAELLNRGLRNLSQDEITKFNRLLLEAVFSQIINRSYKSYILISDDTHKKMQEEVIDYKEQLGIMPIKLVPQKLKGFAEKKTVFKIWKKGW